MTEKVEDIVEEGKRLVDRAAERGLVLRLLGGVAVALLCPSATCPPFRRPYADLDFVAQTSSRRTVTEFLEACGYRPNVMFNKLQPHRMYFSCDTFGRHVDIFFREFSMCHRYVFSDRSFAQPYTLPLDELLLTKLQIVELSEKDLQDSAAIIESFASGGVDGDAGRCDALTTSAQADWGLYKTTSTNLDRLRRYLASVDIGETRRSRAFANLETLRKRIEDAPKSMRWRLRASIGERVRWYELPEDPTRERISIG